MENKIPQFIIDFCGNWNVDIKYLPLNEFKNSNLMINPGLRDVAINISGQNKNIFYTDFIYSKNRDISILHELAHIQMRVIPNFINDIESPLISMHFLNCLHCKFKHGKLFKDKWTQKMLAASLKKKSFKDYLKYNFSILESNGLIDKNNRPTFNMGNVRPTVDWGIEKFRKDMDNKFIFN